MPTALKTKAKTKSKTAISLPKEKLEGKQYHEAVGRRKTSTARVRIWTTKPEYSVKSGYFFVNSKALRDYFSREDLLEIALGPIALIKSTKKFLVSAKVSGGGIKGQAEAVRLGLSRALVKFFPNFRKKLKKAGFLTRDARMVERKKPGLKKARRAPQWQKR